MRALEAGSLVCFYTSLGELVTVKKGVKTWELHACLAPSPPNAEGQPHLTNIAAVMQMVITQSVNSMPGVQVASDCHIFLLKQCLL